MTNPLQFIRETRAEISKVVWPGRREVLITTGMVLIMATIFALFFTGVDAGIRTLLQMVLDFFR